MELAELNLDERVLKKLELNYLKGTYFGVKLNVRFKRW